jgi:hypothetical protein
MSQTSKIILTAVLAALIAGSGVYLWQNSQTADAPVAETPEQEITETEVVAEPAATTEIASSNEWAELIQSQCELSGGTFADNSCECPIEEDLGQTQESMYDKSTGYCQNTVGGPGGDAFAASVGLPHGNYSFWTKIVGNNCTETGGTWLNAKCTCSDGTSYSESTGNCS